MQCAYARRVCRITTFFFCCCLFFISSAAADSQEDSGGYDHTESPLFDFLATEEECEIILQAYGDGGAQYGEVPEVCLGEPCHKTGSGDDGAECAGECPEGKVCGQHPNDNNFCKCNPVENPCAGQEAPGQCAAGYCGEGSGGCKYDGVEDACVCGDTCSGEEGAPSCGGSCVGNKACTYREVQGDCYCKPNCAEKSSEAWAPAPPGGQCPNAVCSIVRNKCKSLVTRACTDSGGTIRGSIDYGSCDWQEHGIIDRCVVGCTGECCPDGSENCDTIEIDLGGPLGIHQEDVCIDVTPFE